MTLKDFASPTKIFGPYGRGSKIKILWITFYLCCHYIFIGKCI